MKFKKIANTHAARKYFHQY